jgi:DNA-binding CsgD family transcriptional regulator
MAAKILKMDENTIRKYIRNKQILTGNSKKIFL